MLENIKGHWAWYISGPLIGLMVPLLLLVGNKRFGVSSNLRHICAACIPSRIPFFQYDWKAEAWNLFVAAGIVIGAFIAYYYLRDNSVVLLNPALVQELDQYGIRPGQSLVPTELFNWNNLLTLKGILMIVGGGFLIGFGTRYAGGCTSGHSIMGISNLQWPSIIATTCFMIGGMIMANIILPIILNW